MMLFRQLEDSMVQLLGDNANGEFRVFGYQTSPEGADEFTGKNRAVRVYYAGGKFPQNASSADGPIRHAVEMMIEIIVTSSSKIDIDILESPTSTPTEKAAAFLASKEAAYVANKSWNEVADLIWNIVMDAQHIDLGLPEYTLGKAKWVDSIEKDRPISNGEYVILTGSMPVSTTVREEVGGETPVPADPTDGGLSTGMPLAGDNTIAAGFNNNEETE